VATIGAHRLGEAQASERTVARRALSQSLGFASLAVSSECTLVRSLMEGLSGCLGDVAGGYCTYTSCDVVTRPDLSADAPSSLTVVKPGR
jgi:hypothetical protein